MIRCVRLEYFKKFSRQVFELPDRIVLAGPNNSGKTTLLQAIAVWNMALRVWKERRGPESGSKAKERTGVQITRKDFTAIPLREMNLLWTDTSTGLRKQELRGDQKLGQPRVMSIGVEGQSGDELWELTFEFTYQNSELLHVRPSKKHIHSLPKAAQDVSVVHVPPFSGIGAEETRFDRPYQDLLVGQGKAGDILRNLLLEVYTHQDATLWEALRSQIKDIFGLTLLPPEYEGRPFIVCEYLCGIPEGKGKNGLAQLDIASAGSGFHQVLLLLGFIYARPASVLLIDEPDAHLHMILQKQIYDRLREIAAKRSVQLIIATHSEVLIGNTGPTNVMSFFDEPHLLIDDVEQDQVREALRRLSATDMLLAEDSPGILYVEGGSDFSLLKAWAAVLRHPLSGWLNSRPFWQSNHGRNPREARGHFFALRAIRPSIKGVLLLDGDNRGLPDHEIAAEGLQILRWKRYEAESYLVHPVALERFVEGRGIPLLRAAAMDFLRDQLPPNVLRNPLGDHELLMQSPVSKAILPQFFKRADVQLTKDEYYLVAEQMQQEEIQAEVCEKLDLIQRTFGIPDSTK